MAQKGVSGYLKDKKKTLKELKEATGGATKTKKKKGRK